MLGSGRFLRPEILEQPGEGSLECIVVLPVREVGDEVFADLDTKILSTVRVESVPLPDRVEVNQPDREQLPLALLSLRVSSLTNLSLHSLNR